MSALRQAREALEAGDRVAALDHLLTAWRELKAPPIAEAIEAVSADVARAVPSLNPTLSRRLYQEAWLDLAGRSNAADLPRLLEGLAHPPLTDFKERLARLEARPDDPRIAARLARIVLGIGTAYDVDLLGTPRVFRLLERIGDVRVRETLLQKKAQIQRHHDRELSDRGGAILNAQIDRTLAALPADAPAVSAAELERVDVLARGFATAAPLDAQALVDARAPVARSEEQLLEQIYGAPGDDTARRVYSDWLLERGDARGEFIALQFKSIAGKLTKAERKRERELLKQHRRTWLGPIEPVIDTDELVFERGFVSEARVQFRTEQQRAQLTDHPAWSTLRKLRLTRDDPAPFVLGCALRGLEEIVGAIPIGLFHQMASRTAPYALEAVELLVPLDLPPLWLARCRAPFSLPMLTRLTVNVPYDAQQPGGPPEERLSWTWDGALSQRLTQLKVATVMGQTAAWVHRYTPLPELRRLEVSGVLRLELTREGRDARWRAVVHVGQVRKVSAVSRLGIRIFGARGNNWHVDQLWSRSSAWLRTELPRLAPMLASATVRCFAETDADTAELRALLKALPVKTEVDVAGKRER